MPNLTSVWSYVLGLPTIRYWTTYSPSLGYLQEENENENGLAFTRFQNLVNGIFDQNIPNGKFYSIGTLACLYQLLKKK